jgi:hypothetical protein
MLSPTRIAATALRIANSQSDDNRTDTPDVSALSKALLEPEGQNFREKLKLLVPTGPNADADAGSLLRGFTKISKMLSFSENSKHFWIPDVLIASLPTDLWQVLVYWAVENPNIEPDSCRTDLVRFVLFWQLCVWNDGKAARWAFAFIKENLTNGTIFPGFEIYKRLTGVLGDDSCAYALMSPEEFNLSICGKPPSFEWRTHEERFMDSGVTNNLGLLWWWKGKRILPWLQKEYIKRAFPGYMPLTDNEDDLPYDVDHICPANDWGGDWRNVIKRTQGLNEGILAKMKNGRSAVGDGIGNQRLVESSINRRDQDDDLADKMPFINVHQRSSLEFLQDCLDSAFPFDEEHLELWRKVAKPGPLDNRIWDADRLQAFQSAVEHRASWLYKKFFDDLQFSSWKIGKSELASD